MYIDVECPTLRYILHNEVRIRFPGVLTTDSLGNSNKVIIARSRLLSHFICYSMQISLLDLNVSLYYNQVNRVIVNR